MSTAVTALALWSPEIAAACACCDGHTLRTPLGFRDGALLLRLNRIVGCEPSEAVEWWRPSAEEPALCADLHDGGRKTSCESLTREWHRPVAGIPAWSRPTTAVRSVAPRFLRARRSEAPDSEAGAPPRELLEVELLTGGRWVSLHREPFLQFSRESQDESPPPAVDVVRIALLVGPTPDGKLAIGPSHGSGGGARGTQLAALLIEGEDTHPGIGNDETRVVWVRVGSVPLVAGTRRVTAISTPPVSPPAAHPAEQDGKQSSTTGADDFNQRGLAQHRAGAYSDAERWFAGALAVEPTHVMSRYNLACTTARLGYPERALAELATLLQLATPAQAAARRSRARVDPDLATVRRLPAFQTLVPK